MRRFTACPSPHARWRTSSSVLAEALARFNAAPESHSTRRLTVRACGGASACRHAAAVTIAASLVLASAPAQAQTLTALQLTFDNDYFNFWVAPDRRSDDNFTHGTFVRATVIRLPAWMRQRHPDCVGRQLDVGATCADVSIGLRQN